MWCADYVCSSSQQLITFHYIECWEDEINQHMDEMTQYNWTSSKSVINFTASNNENDLTLICVRWEHLFRGKGNLAPWTQWTDLTPRTSAFHSSRLHDQGLGICISSSHRHCRKSSRAVAFQSRANSRWCKQDCTCLEEETGSSSFCQSPFYKLKNDKYCNFLFRKI